MKESTCLVFSFDSKLVGLDWVNVCLFQYEEKNNFGEYMLEGLNFSH